MTPVWMPTGIRGFTPGLPAGALAKAGNHSRQGVIQAGMNHISKLQTIVSWTLQLLVAGILLQTLFFKFTGAEESVYIFSRLGAEPWGRLGSGVVELVAALLLLTRTTAPFGATLTMAVMVGAIGSHLTILGIEVKGDGGLLFGLALASFVGSAIVFFIHRAQVPVVGRFFQVA
jgi:putative oxidoreductase